jgi:hypothetical protein
MLGGVWICILATVGGHRPDVVLPLLQIVSTVKENKQYECRTER